jgi:hypothetical protein
MVAIPARGTSDVQYTRNSNRDHRLHYLHRDIIVLQITIIHIMVRRMLFILCRVRFELDLIH